MSQYTAGPLAAMAPEMLELIESAIKLIDGQDLVSGNFRQKARDIVRRAKGPAQVEEGMA